MSQFDRSELVSLAERCFENDCYKDVIHYMKEIIKTGTPFNSIERHMIFLSYDKLILPYVNLYSIPEDSSFHDEKLLKEINLKAQSKANRVSDEAIELLDSY